MKFLNSKEKKGIIDLLEKMYGFRGDVPGHLLMASKEKIFLLEDSDIIRNGQDRELRIDRAGLKVGTMSLGGLRLNVEGSQLFGPHCTKRIVRLDDDHLERWVKGEDLLLSEHELKDTLESSGLFLIRYKDDFIGSGIVKDGKLLNCLSKNRRVKNLNH